MKNILITGVTGQDGKYLVKKLIESKKFNIFGTTRTRDKLSKFQDDLNLIGVNSFQNLNIVQINLEKPSEVYDLINSINPSLVFNLSGPSSVYESLIDNTKTEKQIIKIFDNLTNALIKNENFCNFFQASSSEMFAGNNKFPFDEYSKFLPNSPYGEAKLICHNKVRDLNKKYNWKIVSGIMFNHESGFRTNQFLISKIIDSANVIKEGSKHKLSLGSLDYVRDWLHASDMVDAIYEITLNPKSFSYVIGSGVGHSIRELVDFIFKHYDLEYVNFVVTDPTLLRTGDSQKIVSAPIKLKSEYSWKPKFNFEEMIIDIIKFKNNQLK